MVGRNWEFLRASVERNVAWLEFRFENEGCDRSINGICVDERALVLVTSDGDFPVVRHGAWKEPRERKASLEGDAANWIRTSGSLTGLGVAPVEAGVEVSPDDIIRAQKDGCSHQSSGFREEVSKELAPY